MSYRTKYHNLIWNNYLNKVFDFIGLTLDPSSGCSRVKWVGCSFTKDNKPVPVYFTTMKYDSEHKVDIHKINVVIRTQDEFFNYKANKDNYEYFNPIIKYKQMLKLLLMMAPVIYERYCITESDGIDDLVDMIVSDERTITQEEIIKHVNIKQYPSVPGPDGETVYGFAMEITRDNGETCLFKAESKNKSAAILLLMLQVIELIDGTGDMDSIKFNTEVKVMLEDAFEEYAKERERNYKDLKNVVIEKDVTDFNNSEQPTEDDISFFNDTDDLISPNTSTKTEGQIIEENTDKSGVINLSTAFQGYVPIMPKESDDDPGMDMAFL